MVRVKYLSQITFEDCTGTVGGPGGSNVEGDTSKCFVFIGITNVLEAWNAAGIIYCIFVATL